MTKYLKFTDKYLIADLINYIKFKEQKYLNNKSIEYKQSLVDRE